MTSAWFWNVNITFNQIPTIYHKVHVLVGYIFLYIRKVNFNKSCKLYKIILCLFLQVEISLGDDCQYHSIFACPILRQQSTNSNHPVRLVCGHCISKDALTKLATANKYVSETPPQFNCGLMGRNLSHVATFSYGVKYTSFLVTPSASNC